MSESSESKELKKSESLADMSMGVFSSIGVYEDYRRMATDLANSDLIPQAFQKKPANVLIAVNMANRMRADPFMVMQSMYIVHGKPAFSASFVAAVIEESGKFGHLNYEMCGTPGQDDYGCRITTNISANGQEIQGTWVTIAMAKAEGWYGKTGSKWPNMPEQMLRYRAVSFFGRLYAGAILLGMQTKEELDDIKDVNPVPGQETVTKADMVDSLVGEVVKDDVPHETTNKSPEEKPVTTEKPKDVKKSAADKKAEEKKQKDTPDEEDKDSNKNPWTAEGLVKTIEQAVDIDAVNEALSCTTGFSRPDQKKVMQAASAKNKELAEKRKS